MESLSGFSHVYRLDDLNTLLSQEAVSLKWLPLWEWWAERTFQGQGKGCAASDGPGPAHGSNNGHVLSVTSSNTFQYGFHHSSGGNG